MAVSHPSQNSPLLERSEEHTSELQSPCNLVCRLLLEKKKKKPAFITASASAVPAMVALPQGRCYHFPRAVNDEHYLLPEFHFCNSREHASSRMLVADR